MKKWIIFALVLGLLAVCAGCGTSSQAVEASGTLSADSSEVEKAQENDSGEMEEMLESVDMLYYLKLGDNSIMAACYTDEGISIMGRDYYVIHLGDAELYNAAGQPITLDELTRGCPIHIQWPGMIMESYPGQLSAAIVTAISDEADPSVPAEDEIPSVDGGVKWWEPELQRELPSMTVEYTTADYAVAMFLGGTGEWSYQEDGQTMSMIACGEDPLAMKYNDHNTCKRNGFDTVTLQCSVPWSSISVKAYVDGSSEGQDVSVDADGTMSLLDGNEVIYVIYCQWDTEIYGGYETFCIKVVTPTAE